MTQTHESNLMDRIEQAIDRLTIDQIAERNARLAMGGKRAHIFSTRAGLVTERDARLAMRQDLGDFYHTVREWAESIDGSISRLTEKVDRVTDRVDRLAELMGQFAQEAREDRAAIREMQAESRQIRQYLLSQRPNGSSGQ